MGLTDAVRDRTTTEEGTAFVDTTGRSLARFPAGDDPDGPTAELEILRGDLAGLLRDQVGEVRYGRQITGTTDDGTDLEVTFRSGQRERYDLLVIAEGVRSTTRDLVFGPEVGRRELGLNIVYGTIPRTEQDDRWWRWYTATASSPGLPQVGGRPERLPGTGPARRHRPLPQADLPPRPPGHSATGSS
jgi:2-polyprenyl-6-methoxyphenol hydroxylase-like FAD-dependent oxidoreductase